MPLESESGMLCVLPTRPRVMVGTVEPLGEYERGDGGYSS